MNRSSVATFIALVWLASFSWTAHESWAGCPAWTRASAQLPKCPTKPSILSDEYPLGAIILPTHRDFRMGQEGYESALELPVQAFEKFCRASGDRPPLFVLSTGSQEAVHKIRTAIRERKNLTDAEKTRCLPQLVSAPGTQGVRWNQDIGQPVYNPTRRRVEFRSNLIHDSDHEKASVPSLVQTLQGCALASPGTALPQQPEKPVQGTKGGNMEGATGGLCLLGSSDFASHESWLKFGQSICAEEDLVKVPTSWLEVAHTDEIVKVVPKPGNSGTDPCSFTLLIASPEKARDLLRASPQEPWLDGRSSAEPSSSNSDLIQRRRVSSAHRVTGTICNTIRELPPLPSRPNGKEPTGTGRGAKLQIPVLISSAWAGSTCSENYPSPSSAEAWEAIGHPKSPLKPYNDQIQAVLNSFKNELVAKLAKKTGCAQPDVLEVPAAFHGGYLREGSKELPDRGAKFISPPATNAQLVERTLIMPDPGNRSFREYMGKELAKRGLKSEFIDTYDYSFADGGNLHCITNEVRICAP